MFLSLLLNHDLTLRLYSLCEYLGVLQGYTQFHRTETGLCGLEVDCKLKLFH